MNNLICSSILIDGMFLFTFQNLGVKGGGGCPCTLIEQSRCDPYNEILCLSHGACTCVYLQFIFHYNIWFCKKHEINEHLNFMAPWYL